MVRRRFLDEQGPSTGWRSRTSPPRISATFSSTCTAASSPTTTRPASRAFPCGVCRSLPSAPGAGPDSGTAGPPGSRRGAAGGTS
ncbi:MAG: hypothetical protein MZU84_01260 [Sphingobacterium sp.]|nr:hypothetical protein [Sphingobacterium sp.]